MANTINKSALPTAILSDDDTDQWEDAMDDASLKGDANEKLASRRPDGAGNVLKPMNNGTLETSNASSRANGLDKNVQSKDPIAEVDDHPLLGEISRISAQQLKHALTGVEDGCWELFVESGELKMYKMEQELGGVVCDPLKAVHSVKGVCAREYIDLFFHPDLKSEWDETLVRMKIVERLSQDTVILHQVHKRIWPSAQRESLFWSQKSDVSDHKEVDALDAFMMCSHDTAREDVPLTDSSCVRVELTIAMLCQTVVEPHGKHLSVEQLKREHVRCKITYVAQVHPGGWVPSAALRQVYKREYPKFLRKFTQYVADKVKKEPLKL